MPDRKFKIENDDWGTYRLKIIYRQEDGTWENDDWERVRAFPPLRPIVDLFSEVDFITYDRALKGDTMPLIRELGPPPDGCLKKCPDDILPCTHRDTCPAWDEDACHGDLSPPPCYVVDGENLIDRDENSDLWGPEYQYMLNRILDLWRSDFYITVVENDGI